MCGPNFNLKAAANNGASWLASNNESAGKKSTSRVIFPRRKAGENYHTARPVKVTRQMLESLTHLPLPNACQKLGLCATTFKKACRREGIMQWPYKRGCAQEERANNAMSAIMIPEPSYESSSSYSEGDYTSSSSSSSSPDESSDAAPQSSCSPSPRSSSSSPCSSSTTAEEPTYTEEEDAGACAAPDVDFLEQGFFGSDLSFLQDPYFQDVAIFDEEDSAFLRMTGWDAPI
jgi:hypothetical protein